MEALRVSNIKCRLTYFWWLPSISLLFVSDIAIEAGIPCSSLSVVRDCALVGYLSFLGHSLVIGDSMGYAFGFIVLGGHALLLFFADQFSALDYALVVFLELFKCLLLVGEWSCLGNNFFSCSSLRSYE